MAPRATLAATVPLDCGSTAIVAASPMAAAVARTVSGFRRHNFTPATPRGFRNTAITSRLQAPSGMWVIVGRISFPARETSSALVLVLSTQFRCFYRCSHAQGKSHPPRQRGDAAGASGVVVEKPTPARPQPRRGYWRGLGLHCSGHKARRRGGNSERSGRSIVTGSAFHLR